MPRSLRNLRMPAAPAHSGDARGGRREFSSETNSIAFPARATCSASASAIAWFAMKLLTAQQAELRAATGICANEVCDACRKPLDYLRYTRKDQPMPQPGSIETPLGAGTAGCDCLRRQVDSKYCDAACKKASQRGKAASANG
jgi:hypothetical protein